MRPISDHLPRVDPATQEMRLKYWQDVQHKLAAIHRAQLSPAEQVNYDVYTAQIAVLVANQRFRDFEAPANADTTFWTDIGYTARRPFRTLEDYRHWISQMQDIPRYFHEQMDEMRAGLKRGFTPPQVTMQGRDASLTAVTEATPEASLFYTPFSRADARRCRRLARRELKAAAVKTIREVVQPAYVELLNFMRNEYVPGMRTTLAAQELPDGKAYYRAKILEYTTLDMDPAADPRAWRGGGAAAACSEMVDRHARDRLQGRVPGVPEIPALRPALLREDAGRAADARRLDRQALRRQGRAVLRLPAAGALCDQAGAG